jgi:biopolymer transport protein ExbD
MPEVNLVPMMDVLMSVLTFFIITSMNLTGQNIAGVSLPKTGSGATEQKATKQLVIGLNQQGEILLDNQTINQAELNQKIKSYLAENPQGIVILKGDRKLTYKQVSQFMRQMQTVGGDRVFLAIEQQ